MHGVGHWMGLDIHDCNTVNRETYKLEAGHIFTIEPGIYISEDLDVPEKYKGIGVRIEDDILVLKDGCEVLSSGVPKEIDEIEALVSGDQPTVIHILIDCHNIIVYASVNLDDVINYWLDNNYDPGIFEYLKEKNIDNLKYYTPEERNIIIEAMELEQIHSVPVHGLINNY